MHPIAVACGLLPAPSLTLTDLRGKVAVVTGANTGIGFRTATNLAKCGATVVFACRSESRARAAMTVVSEELEASRRDRTLSGSRTTSVPGEDWSSRCVLRYEALDLASLASVRTFVDRLKILYPVKTSGPGGGVGGIDILVLNAGLNTRGTTNDGFDVRWQVNYLGHWLLASELFPLLQAARGPRNDGARIVCLSSVMHHFAVPGHFAAHCKPMTLQVLSEASGATVAAAAAKSCYADSKLAMNLLACELQKRFDVHDSDMEPTSITGRSADGNDSDECRQSRDRRFRGRRDSPPLATGGASGTAESMTSATALRRRPRCVAVNPGAVASDIWRGVSPLIRRWLLDPVMALVFLSTDEGSATSMHAAIQPLPPSSDQFSQSRPKPAFLPYLRTAFEENETCVPDCNDSSVGTGREITSRSETCWTEDVPYYAPYLVPQYLPSWFSLPFEVAGPFAGAQLCPPSLPPDISAASAELWGLSNAAVREAELNANNEESEGKGNTPETETVDSQGDCAVSSFSRRSGDLAGSAFPLGGDSDHQALLDNMAK